MFDEADDNDEDAPALVGGRECGSLPAPCNHCVPAFLVPRALKIDLDRAPRSDPIPGSSEGIFSKIIIQNFR